MTPQAFETMADLAEAIRIKRVSPVEAVDDVFRRISETSHFNAFMALCEERARREAANAEAAIMRGDELGALHGVPFSVKDLTNTQEVVTTFGSALHADAVPAEDAVAVARLRAAGAILIGKTTTSEFGHKPFTEGPFFGRTLNPWNAAVTCGGSSGGAAVSLAAGVTPIALGSDGGGSIRIPAACCGVVGFKATLGAIPNLQPPDLFAANSYVGPMARTVDDVRLAFEVLRGPDRRDPYGQTANYPDRRYDAPVRIAWLPNCGNVVDPEVERLAADAIAALEALGYAVEPVELDFVALEQPFLILLRSLLRARLIRDRELRPEALDPTLMATIDAAREISATELLEAQFARSGCFRMLQQLLDRFDIIASPTLSAPPLSADLDVMGTIEIADRDAGTIRAAWYPYTYPFNLSGHPAISLPCGLTADGLPVGFQLAGRWHDDHLLLDVAARLERALRFNHRPPAVARPG